MNSVFQIPRCIRGQVIRQSPERPNRRHGDAIVVLAIFAAGIMLPAPTAYADDPCSDTDREVTKAVKSLQGFNHLIAKDGLFQVKQLSAPGQPLGPFELTYLIGGHEVFKQRIAYPTDEIANAFVIKPLRNKDGAKLELSYGMGAGGRIGCEYKVYDIGGRFIAKRGKW